MKPALKVLQLGTYPIVPAIHGGQRRVAALERAYRLGGVETSYVAVYNPHGYKVAASPFHLPAGSTTLARVAKQPPLEDVIFGEELDRDPAVGPRLVAHWKAFQPDVLQMESPFLWPGVKRLLLTRKVPAPKKIVYSSQNVETTLKAGIYANALPRAEARTAVEKIKAMEEELLRLADLTIAVSAKDADALRAMGAKRCLVIRNGGDIRTCRPETLRRWQQILRTYPKRRALFVSSGHLPNYYGFHDLLGPELGYLSPDMEILVAGSIISVLQGCETFGPHHLVNRSRLHLLLGDVTDDDLGALFQLCQCVVLPITSPAGSNLKTVEALLSGRPVVASHNSFVGYEEFVDEPAIRKVDDQAFKKTLYETLRVSECSGEPTPLRPSPHAESLTWDRLGRDLVGHVNELFQ